jgi:uncharacterized protein YndB with AHSA1/START domain
MSRNVIEINAPIDVVFDVLLDAEQYPRWVVGAKRIRDVDDTWPAPGSAFHHAVGAGPAEVRDKTKVVEIEPPTRLMLEARFRPPGVACVELELEPLGPDRTRVIMLEHGLEVPGPIPSRVAQLLADPLVTVRNWLSLRRLKQLAEARVATR